MEAAKTRMNRMAIDESKLTKGLLRKLDALRKSVGKNLGDEVLAKWLTQQAQVSAPKVWVSFQGERQLQRRARPRIESPKGIEELSTRRSVGRSSWSLPLELPEAALTTTVRGTCCTEASFPARQASSLLAFPAPQPSKSRLFTQAIMWPLVRIFWPDIAEGDHCGAISSP